MQTSVLLESLAVRHPRRRVVSLSAPWGARIPSADGQPGIYLVASGVATLSVRGKPPVSLEAGDVAVLPQGCAHVIASRPDAVVCPVEEFCATAASASPGYVAGGGGGISTELRTLCFDVEDSTSRAITTFAPSLVVLRAREARPWFSHLVRATVDLCSEAERVPELAQCRLGELLLLEALAGNILAGAREVDPPVLRAVVLLRSNLSAKWTVPALARAVGVSRSAFYDRFVRAMGCSPGAYMLRARMEEAAVLLGEGVSVDHVAMRVGYDWPSSFTVAFHRFHGIAPSAYKRNKHRSAR